MSTPTPESPAATSGITASPSPEAAGSTTTDSVLSQGEAAALAAALAGPPEGVDGRSTRWDAHRAQRRAELVTATVRAIRTHGAGVGMDDIAATAGTSKTVFYRHFEDRAGLYRAVAEHVDLRLLDRVVPRLPPSAVRGQPAALDSVDGSSAPATSSAVEATTMASPATATASSAPATSSSASAPGPVTSPRGLLRASVDAYLRLVEEDPEVYRFVVAAPLVPTREGDGRDLAADVTAAMSSRVVELLVRQLQATGQSPDRAMRWARAVVGLVRSAGDDWLRAGASASGTPRQALVEDVTTLLWDGLSPVWTS